MTAPRRSVRFGPGELAPAGPNVHVRAAYLEALRRLVPESLHSLAEIAADVADQTPAADAKLRAWCTLWGLTASRGAGDWYRTVARRTARALAQKAPDAPVTWAGVTRSFWVAGQPINPPRWDLHRETEAQYLKLVHAYMATVRKAAASAGWSAVPKKRAADHLAWLVRYQAAGWTQARIAEHYQDADGDPDVRAVSKALKRTAALVGLRLRRGSRGPHRNSP